MEGRRPLFRAASVGTVDPETDLQDQPGCAQNRQDEGREFRGRMKGWEPERACNSGNGAGVDDLAIGHRQTLFTNRENVGSAIRGPFLRVEFGQGRRSASTPRPARFTSSGTAAYICGSLCRSALSWRAYLRRSNKSAAYSCNRYRPQVERLAADRT
jgi:hypothetical protein